MTTTIKDLVDEYCRETEACSQRGEEEPPISELMQTVLHRHPEIAIHLDTFAAMCIAELRRLAEAQLVEADQLQRFHEQ